MAIDELTNELLYEAYSSAPEIKELVDPYQIKYKTHKSQKNESDYNPKDTRWIEDAKKDPAVISAVNRLLEQRKESGLENAVGTSPKKQITQQPTRMDYLIRLAATFAGVALLGGYLI